MKGWVKLMDIIFISAKGCLDCKRMKSYLGVICSAFDNINVIELDSESDDAIDVAVKNDIEDIPACIIGNNVMFGKNGFSYDQMLQAVKDNYE